MKKLISSVLTAAILCSTIAFAGCSSEVLEVTSTAADSQTALVSASTANLSGKLTLNGSTSMRWARPFRRSTRA